ncbi:MAG: RNA polymerase sigma factor [Bacteroidota bacterium]
MPSVLQYPLSRSTPMKFSPQSTDAELLEGCIRKDRLAQKYLYQRYYGQMLGICMRYTKNRDEANDVLNRAFLKVFNSIEKYRSTGSFGGWIARIVLHTAIDFVRSNTTYHKVMDYNLEKDATVYNDAIDQLAAGEIYQLIQQLPPASQSVFSMYVIDGYKHSEIAKTLNISQGTSKWHLNNARKSLQKLLENRNSINP